MQTRAAVVEGQGQPFTIAEVELDDPREDEVLVRMVATGLCHTDITMGSFLPAEMFPNVFGHEGAGVVEAVGPDVSGIEIGDHVVLSFRSCRSCATCEAGLVGYCDTSLMINYMGMRMDGSTTYTRDGAPVFGSFFGQSSFSKHAIAYADNCVVVDQELDLTLAAPYGCGFQTGAGTVLNIFEPGPDDSLVVFGCGAVAASPRSSLRAPPGAARSWPSTSRTAGSRSPRSTAPCGSTPTTSASSRSSTASRSSPAAGRRTRSTPRRSRPSSSRPSSR